MFFQKNGQEKYKNTVSCQCGDKNFSSKSLPTKLAFINKVLKSSKEKTLKNFPFIFSGASLKNLVNKIYLKRWFEPHLCHHHLEKMNTWDQSGHLKLPPHWKWIHIWVKCAKRRDDDWSSITAIDRIKALLAAKT